MGATIDGVFNDAETIPGSGLSVEDFLLLGQKIFKVFSTFDLRVTVDQTRALFDALDSNADGRLDRTEWTRGLSLARQNLSPKLAVSLAHAGCVSARHRLRAQLRRLRTLSDMYAEMAAEDPDAMSDSEEHFVVHGGVLCAECSVAIDWMV